MEDHINQNPAALLENEPDLIMHAKADDDRAFEILYDYYFPRIYSYILKRTGQRETAEDIVSGIFLKVFMNLKDYKPGSHKFSFAAWIFRIATNHLTDHYRKKGKREIVDIDGIGLVDGNSDLEYGTDLLLEREAIRETLKRLPPKYQEVIQLKYFTELSNHEIAAVLGISVNNAGVLLYRALRKFQKNHQKYV